MAGKTNRRSVRVPHRRRVLLALGYYDHQLHRGIARYARTAGWILNTSMAHYGVLPGYWKGDGIITLMFEGRRDIMDYIRSTPASVVDLTANVDIEVPRVLQDNTAIGRIAAEHLMDRGFDQLAYFKFTDAFDVRERGESFEKTVREAGQAFHPLDWCEVSGSQKNRTNWVSWLSGKLASLPKPLGIMAQSDNRAIGVLGICESIGLNVPEEVAVVGVDNDELVCEFAPVQLSSVDSDRETLAFEGAALLDRLMSGEPPPAEPLRIPPLGLVVRKSSDILAIKHAEIANALSYIWDHFTDPIAVDHVLDSTAMSRCGLYRAFRKHVGRTIAAEISRKRIEYAKQLLMETDEKIHRIAGMSGFSGGEHLSRAFTNKVGMNPSVYRKKFRRSPQDGE